MTRQRIEKHDPFSRNTIKTASMRYSMHLPTTFCLFTLIACGEADETPRASDVDESEPTADETPGPGNLIGGPQTHDDLAPSVVPDLAEAMMPSGSCGFTYDRDFPPPPSFFGGVTPQAQTPGASSGTKHGGDAPASNEDASQSGGAIAYADPLPPSVYGVTAANGDDVYLPGYSDNMPLFERAKPWDDTRCFELPNGALMMTEAEAFSFYQAIAERTTGVPIDARVGSRTVLGIRGAYPGTFDWNGNAPNHFNDTLVLLWTDNDGPHVREYPVNTDTGDHNFGNGGSSSLRPNRRYLEEGGWHRGAYEALTIAEYGYRSIDDTNHNGHWDSDRNGWLPPSQGRDYERNGSGHNIHVASVNGPLGSATVQNWSAGCQTLPGMANWTAFITQAWPGNGVDVQYFLVDVRDIDSSAFEEECIQNGTAECPYTIDALPFVDTKSTATTGDRALEGYSCSAADEAGPEIAYLLLLDDYGTLDVSVTDGDGVDIDVHLLDANDPLACLARDDTDFSYRISPGRYYVVADTYVRSDTGEQAGQFTLQVALR